MPSPFMRSKIFGGQKTRPAVFLGSRDAVEITKGMNFPRQPLIFRLGHYYSFYSRVRGALRFSLLRTVGMPSSYDADPRCSRFIFTYNTNMLILALKKIELENNLDFHSPI